MTSSLSSILEQAIVQKTQGLTSSYIESQMGDGKDVMPLETSLGILIRNRVQGEEDTYDFGVSEALKSLAFFILAKEVSCDEFNIEKKERKVRSSTDDSVLHKLSLLTLSEPHALIIVPFIIKYFLTLDLRIEKVWGSQLLEFLAEIGIQHPDELKLAVTSLQQRKTQLGALLVCKAIIKSICPFHKWLSNANSGLSLTVAENSQSNFITGAARVLLYKTVPAILQLLKTLNITASQGTNQEGQFLSLLDIQAYIVLFMTLEKVYSEAQKLIQLDINQLRESSCENRNKPSALGQVFLDPTHDPYHNNTCEEDEALWCTWENNIIESMTMLHGVFSPYENNDDDTSYTASMLRDLIHLMRTSVSKHLFSVRMSFRHSISRREDIDSFNSLRLSVYACTNALCEVTVSTMSGLRLLLESLIQRQQPRSHGASIESDGKRNTWEGLHPYYVVSDTKMLLRNATSFFNDLNEKSTATRDTFVHLTFPSTAALFGIMLLHLEILFGFDGKDYIQCSSNKLLQNSFVTLSHNLPLISRLVEILVDIFMLPVLDCTLNRLPRDSEVEYGINSALPEPIYRRGLHTLYSILEVAAQTNIICELIPLKLSAKITDAIFKSSNENFIPKWAEIQIVPILSVLAAQPSRAHLFEAKLCEGAVSQSFGLHSGIQGRGMLEMSILKDLLRRKKDGNLQGIQYHLLSSIHLSSQTLTSYTSISQEIVELLKQSFFGHLGSSEHTLNECIKTSSLDLIDQISSIVSGGKNIQNTACYLFSAVIACIFSISVGATLPVSDRRELLEYFWRILFKDRCSEAASDIQPDHEGGLRALHQVIAPRTPGDIFYFLPSNEDEEANNLKDTISISAFFEKSIFNAINFFFTPLKIDSDIQPLTPQLTVPEASNINGSTKTVIETLSTWYVHKSFILSSTSSQNKRMTDDAELNFKEEFHKFQHRFQQHLTKKILASSLPFWEHIALEYILGEVTSQIRQLGTERLTTDYTSTLLECDNLRCCSYLLCLRNVGIVPFSVVNWQNEGLHCKIEEYSEILFRIAIEGNDHVSDDQRGSYVHGYNGLSRDIRRLAAELLSNLPPCVWGSSWYEMLKAILSQDVSEKEIFEKQIDNLLRLLLCFCTAAAQVSAPPIVDIDEKWVVSLRLSFQKEIIARIIPDLAICLFRYIEVIEMNSPASNSSFATNSASVLVKLSCAVRDVIGFLIICTNEETYPYTSLSRTDVMNVLLQQQFDRHLNFLFFLNQRITMTSSSSKGKTSVLHSHQQQFLFRQVWHLIVKWREIFLHKMIKRDVGSVSQSLQIASSYFSLVLKLVVLSGSESKNDLKSNTKEEELYESMTSCVAKDIETFNSIVWEVRDEMQALNPLSPSEEQRETVKYLNQLQVLLKIASES